MDPTTWWALFLVLLAADVLLWCLGLMMDVSPDARFRLITAAALLLYPLLVLLLPLPLASAAWFLALWIYAVLAGMGRGLAAS